MVNTAYSPRHAFYHDAGANSPRHIFWLLQFLVLTYGIYEQIREKISVGDVLDGRYFKCRSVVMLAGKEQLMNNLSVIFCRFLEAMKTWGGQEIIQLDPYNLPEIRIVEFPPYAYS